MSFQINNLINKKHVQILEIEGIVLGSSQKNNNIENVKKKKLKFIRKIFNSRKFNLKNTRVINYILWKFENFLK